MTMLVRMTAQDVGHDDEACRLTHGRGVGKHGGSPCMHAGVVSLQLLCRGNCPGPWHGSCQARVCVLALRAGHLGPCSCVVRVGGQCAGPVIGVVQLVWAGCGLPQGGLLLVRACSTGLAQAGAAEGCMVSLPQGCKVASGMSWQYARGGGEPWRQVDAGASSGGMTPCCSLRQTAAGVLVREPL